MVKFNVGACVIYKSARGNFIGFVIFKKIHYEVSKF